MLITSNLLTSNMDEKLRHSGKMKIYRDELKKYIDIYFCVVYIAWKHLVV